MKAKMEMKITLELTQQEAEWLKAVMQNPFSVNLDFDDEDPKNKEFRDKFWHGLHEEGVRTI